MSILTWRDVSTPDFGASVFAQRNANDAMNNAFASLQSSLQGYKDAKADVADRNIYTHLLNYQNPDDLKAALSDGSLIGNNSQFAHASVLAGLPKQVGDMLQNALTQAQTHNTEAEAAGKDIGNTQTGVLNKRGNTEYDAMQNASPVINDIINRYQGKGPNGVAAAMSELENHPLVQKLNPAQLASVRDQLTTGLNAPSSGRNLLLNTDITGQDAANENAAKNEFARITTPGGQFVTAQDQLNEINNIKNPLVRAKVISQFSPMHPGLVPQAPDTTEMNRNILGGTGMDYDNERAVYLPGGKTNANGQNVVPDKDFSQMTGADAMAFGQKMLDAQGNTKTASSAKTEYMFTNGTMKDAMQSLFQSDSSFRGDAKSWDQVKLTPENRDKMGQWVFDRATKNDNLGDVWKALKPEDIQEIKANGNDWNLARALLISRENGASLDSVINRMHQQETMRRGVQQGQDITGSNNQLVAKYSKFVDAGIGDDLDKAADFLSTNSPDFKGYDHHVLRDNIQSIINHAKDTGTPINAAKAALILSESTTADQLGSGTMNFLQNVFHPGNQRQSHNGAHVDMSTVNKLIPQVTSPSMDSEASSYIGRKASTTMQQQATDAFFQKAMADYKQAETNYKNNPTPEFKKLYMNARSNLVAGSVGQARSDANQYSNEAPPPNQTNDSGSSKASAILGQAASQVTPDSLVQNLHGMSQSEIENALSDPNISLRQEDQIRRQLGVNAPNVPAALMNDPIVTRAVKTLTSTGTPSRQVMESKIKDLKDNYALTPQQELAIRRGIKLKIG